MLWQRLIWICKGENMEFVIAYANPGNKSKKKIALSTLEELMELVEECGVGVIIRCKPDSKGRKQLLVYDYYIE